MRTCRQCHNFISCVEVSKAMEEDFDPDFEGEEFCTEKCFQPMTKADRIRAMTDEELADWLARTQIENVMEFMNILHIPYDEKDGMKESMAEECLEWLKQPVEAEDGNG